MVLACPGPLLTPPPSSSPPKTPTRSYSTQTPPRNGNPTPPPPGVCVFITAGPSTKLFAWGGGDIGRHVLRETTSRGLCGLVCPSRTSERGGEGDCVKEGGGEGEREKERAVGLLRFASDLLKKIGQIWNGAVSHRNVAISN